MNPSAYASQTYEHPTAGEWTDEREKTLKKLWGDGLSASQIAAELGSVTRNAVIGKVHRLGLSGRAKGQSLVPASPIEPTTKSHQYTPKSKKSVPLAPELDNPPPPPAALPATQPAGPAPQAAQEVVIPFYERVTIMELREYMCRWPMGDPTTPEFRFCGGRSQTGKAYCSYHMRIAHPPPAEGRRNKVRQRA